MGDVATTERGRLMLRLDTAEDMEDMEAMAMVAMDVDTMARGKPMLRLDTAEDLVDMVAMDVDTMARGKLMLNPSMVVTDMVAMAVHMEVMADMVIAVKFVPLFIIPPPNH